MAATHIFKLVRSTHEGMPRVCVVGAGHSGIKVLEHLLGDPGAGATVAALHTNEEVLVRSHAQTKVQIGKGSDAQGGCGGSLELGRSMAERDADMLRGLLTDCDLLVMVGGLGGGTAGGTLPVLARLAQAAGVFSVAVATTPFAFEGEVRQRSATEALQSLVAAADFVSVVANDALLDTVAEPNLERAFGRADEAMAAAVFCIWQTLACPGLLALDKTDLQTLLERGAGYCRFFFGMGTGDARVDATHTMLLEGKTAVPLREHLRSAKGAVACICSSRDLALSEVERALTPLQGMLTENVGLHVGVALHRAWRNRFFMAVFVPEPKRKVSVTVREVRKGQTVKGKGPGPRASQEELNLEGTKIGRGRFAHSKATILDGEDLDIPTFIRRGIRLER